MGGNKHVRHCTVRAMARPLTMANDDVGWCSAERKWSHGMNQGASGGSMQTSIEGKSRRRQADRVIHHSVSCPLTLVCPWAAWRQRWLLIPKAPSAQRCILTPHHHLGLGVGTAADAVGRHSLWSGQRTKKPQGRSDPCGFGSFVFEGSHSCHEGIPYGSVNVYSLGVLELLG